MDLKRVVGLLAKDFPGLEFEIGELNNNFIEFHCSFELKEFYKSEIFLKTLLFQNGNAFVSFIFDPVVPNFTNFLLINKFNEEHLLIKAFIDMSDENNFLNLTYFSASLTVEDELYHFVFNSLASLTKGDVIESLKPIVG